MGGLGLALACVGTLHVQAAGPRELGTPARPYAASSQTQPPPPAAASPQRALLDRYCVTCHNERLRTGGLALDTLDVAHVGEAPEVWEKVVQKLRGGMMPPAGRRRPDPEAYEGFRSWLETSLDAAAASITQRVAFPRTV